LDEHEIFPAYLQDLREQVPSGKRIALMGKLHASHCATDDKQFAARLNIELLNIPPGATD
jgi:hypothetical protein